MECLNLIPSQENWNLLFWTSYSSRLVFSDHSAIPKFEILPWPQWHLTHGFLRPLIPREQVWLPIEKGQDEFDETKSGGHSVLSKRSRIDGCESVVWTGVRPCLCRVLSCGLYSAPSRTVYEDSGPGRPLSCFMEEPAPYTDGPGAAAGGGNCRFVESPSQDQRLQAQRLRNPEVRGSLQTPQNRPHGHQSPELPEGYGEGAHPPFQVRLATCPSPVSDLFW